MHRILFGVLLSMSMTLSGCSDSSNIDAVGASKQSVVLYTSADDQIARLLADAFTAKTGIDVQILGDTEATKTTGLVARILAERDNPVGDVWWSSEPMGTILLDEQGVLEAGAMQGSVPTDWPSELHDDDWTWVGFAQRARVIVYAENRVAAPPSTMHDLIDPKWKGRIGIARPQFGTTRGHMALLHARWGDESFRGWLRALKDNRVRLYAGNAGVVQGVAMGEIDVGLTDTDDVYAGQNNGWDVAMIPESVTQETGDDPTTRSEGTTSIPNTVAVISGAPNPENARTLAAFLVSPTAERILSESASKNFPVHPSLADEFSDDLDGWTMNVISYLGAHESVDEAMDACERTLEGP